MACGERVCAAGEVEEEGDEGEAGRAEGYPVGAMYSSHILEEDRREVFRRAG